jgi:ABC-2 type transport system ATP-binding protein
MIRLIHITKRYGATLALDQLTLTIPQGAIFGLLGPNGAGKSTLINLLMGFIFPDAGSIEHTSITPARMGYVPERPFFPTRCPAGEYLRVAGALSGLPNAILRETVAARLKQVGLAHAAQWRINQFSKGMLQRLALAQALLADPAFLILDEPMNGLDPTGQKASRDLIKTIGHDGKTVLFSTHRLDDIADVCTHVGILKQGRLVCAGTLNEVLPLRAQVVITTTCAVQAGSFDQSHSDIAVRDNTITLTGIAIARKAEILRQLLDAGIDIQNLTHQRATLEEVYLEAQR